VAGEAAGGRAAAAAAGVEELLDTEQEEREDLRSGWGGGLGVTSLVEKRGGIRAGAGARGRGRVSCH
jgi:hypothetical protein